MEKKKKLSKVVMWIVVALIIALGGYMIGRVYTKPLAPTMAAPTSDPAEPVTQPSTTQPTDLQPAVVPTDAPSPACGATGSMNILFLGSDASAGNPPYGADSVRLIKVDYDAQKVTLVSFPRDLIVQTAALNNTNIPQAPLGLTFKYANQAATGTNLEKNAAAAGIVAQVLADDFGAASEHYITVEMSQFSSMIDTIGGVEINIPEQITTERGITFTAGQQILNGYYATEYVRAIQPGGDSARNLRQDVFLKALKSKVISASILPQIPALLTQFKDAVVTDLSPEELVSFACLASKLQDGGVSFTSVNTPDLVNGVTPNVDAIKTFLTQTLGQ